MKRKFIINPCSGKGITPAAVARLREFFLRETGQFDCSLAHSRQAAIRLTRESLRQGADQVIAVGGDGTVNSVINGFFEGGRPIRPQCSLLVARAGTGADYFKAVTAGRRGLDWRKLALEHAIRPVDVGLIRYQAPEVGDQYFANMTSVGMIADVVRRKDCSGRWVPSRLRYALPTVRTVLTCRPEPLWVEIDGVGRQMEVLAISICKGRCAGGGIKFGGGVTLFDGLFDVTVFRPMKRAEMLLKLGKLYAGRFEREPAVEKCTARRVTIRCPSSLPVEFDGELFGTTDVEICVEPRAIRMCLPKQSAGPARPARRSSFD